MRVDGNDNIVWCEQCGELPAEHFDGYANLCDDCKKLEDNMSKVSENLEAKITDIIYDTLMENKNPPYEAFDLSKVTEQEVDNTLGHIMFKYDGVLIKMNVTAFP